MPVIVEEQSYDWFLITSPIDTVMFTGFMFYANLHMKQNIKQNKKLYPLFLHTAVITKSIEQVFYTVLEWEHEYKQTIVLSF